LNLKFTAVLDRNFVHCVTRVTPLKLIFHLLMRVNESSSSSVKGRKIGDPCFLKNGRKIPFSVSNMKKSNMYPLSVKQWNLWVGCRHDCLYCRPSFQAQLRRWAKSNCELCLRFEPHPHPERFGQKLPKTRYMQFIFTCACGDVAFCPTGYLEKIVERIRMMPDRTFLIQSKNPATFRRVKWLKT